MVKLLRKARERIAGIVGHRTCRVERHRCGVFMTVPHTPQVRYAALE